jgi:exonuclease V gamma subunit
MTIKEEEALDKIARVVADMVAREDQRIKDKIREDTLRATVRNLDDHWRSDITDRIDRVQTSVQKVSDDLADSLLARISDSDKLRQQSDDIVSKMDAHAKQVAADLDEKRQSIAADLAVTAVQTADVLKKRQEGQVVRRFFGKYTKALVIIIVCLMLAALSYSLLAGRHDNASDLALGLTSVVGASALIIGLQRK